MAKARRKKRAAEGFEGAIEREEQVRISGRRTETRFVRSMPGTFDWRYGRDTADPLFLAGSHFAQLWERASHLSGGAIDIGSAGGSMDWKGLPDGKCVAMETVGHAMREIGKQSSARLVDYCVLGLTSTQIARKHGIGDRDIAPVLHQDVRACAIHFRYM